MKEEKTENMKQASPYEILFESSEGKLQDDSGVLIERVTLLKDNNENRIIARCFFRSLTEKPIKALLFDVNAKDVWGNPAEGLKGVQLLDQITSNNTLFGQNEPIVLPDKNARSIDVVIKKIMYADGSMIDCAETFAVVPPMLPLAVHLGDDALAEEYAHETTEHSRYVPYVGDNIWRCSCGTIHTGDKKVCPYCNADRNILIAALDPEQLKANSAARLEEKEKQEQAVREAKKAKNRKITKIAVIVFAGLIVAAAATYGIGWHLIPHIRYSNAAKDVENNKFDEAYETYASLVGYKDSYDKAIETVYQKAEYLVGQKKYTEAAAEYRRVKDYKDSTEKMAFCTNEAAYLNAMDLYNAKDYDAAAKAFRELGDYSDSAEWVNKSYYTNANELFDSGDYEEAQKYFELTSNYKDSDDKIIECDYNVAENAFAAGDYRKAYQGYKSLDNYKDCKQKASESLYLLADSLMRSKNYKNALENYNILQFSYKDVPEKRKEASYLYAKSLYDAGKYSEAIEYFRKVVGYKKTDKLIKEAKYQVALDALDGWDYEEAIRLFGQLGNYKKSRSKINEAKYYYVDENMDDDDILTYRYLKDLTAIGYKDSKSIYSSLYKWKASIVINNKSKDKKHHTNVSRFDKIYCHFKIKGGTPNGSTKIRCKFVWPDGSTTNGNESKYNWERGDSSWWCFWYTNPAYGRTGWGTFKIYDASGNLMGQKSVSIRY